MNTWKKTSFDGRSSGVWRDQPRLYVDASTTLSPAGETNDDEIPQLTRLGLLRTAANVKGHVVSIRRVLGCVWMENHGACSLMLWDGHHIAEVAAFGSSINQRLLGLRPGDGVAMTVLKSVGAQGFCSIESTTEKPRLETFTIS